MTIPSASQRKHAPSGQKRQPATTGTAATRPWVRMLSVAQPLHEIQRRIARRQLERPLAGHEETLSPGVAVRTLGDRRDHHAGDAKLRQTTLRGVELSLAAVDKDEVWPIWKDRLVVARCPGIPGHGGFFPHEPREAPPQDFPHHGIIVPGNRVAVMDVKRAIMRFDEP